MTTEALRYEDGKLVLLDVRRLPLEEVELVCRDYLQVAEAIRTLAVRGAPAIGIAAAYGVVLGVKNALINNTYNEQTFERIISTLAATRPTAVNLFWALDRMKTSRCSCSSTGLVQRLEAEARAIHAEDIAMNRLMGAYGAELLSDGDSVLTHCNAGALATGGFGTALGVIRAAVEQGKRIHVYADETRPLLQGARLTTYELLNDHIPVTLICDNMAGSLMRQGRIQKVIVGSDRTVANGDVCNKIGTYQVAIMAKYHNIPFYAALPATTLDLAIESGDRIPIEERDPAEVKGYGDCIWAPEPVKVYNPSFDVTPAELVTAIITDRGIARPPYKESLKKLLER